MSVDYSVGVFWGFIVPEAQLFDIEEKQSNNFCEHANADPTLAASKFCPECGRELRMYTYNSRSIKEYLKDAIVCDDDGSEYNCMWQGNVGAAEIQMRHMIDNHGPAPYLVGIWWDSVDPRRDAVTIQFCNHPDDLPTETQIAKLLDENNIPYKEDSFGIYLLNEVY